MNYLIPLGFTALAAVVTYFTCVRPMRHGHHGNAAASQQPDETVMAQVQALRDEVALLQPELDPRDPAQPSAEAQSRQP